MSAFFPKRKTFVLEGIFGVYNYGCEAIVRGTANIIWHYWPDARIIYPSHRPVEDAAALLDLPLQVVPISQQRKKTVTQKLLGKILGTRLPKGSNYDWVIDGDVILSIGGDILTLAPNQRAQDVEAFWQVEHCKSVQQYKKPVVLWGASVGPFDENPHAIKAFLSILNQFRLITIREEVSEQYLKNHGVTDTVFRVADPAFLMEPILPTSHVSNLFSDCNRPIIAVNLSPHSAQYSFTGVEFEAVISAQADMLSKMAETTKANILFVPHVICPWCPGDDDFEYLNRIYQLLGSNMKGQIALLPADLGARRTKGYISQCDAVVAARMHCAVAGVSSSVPTLFLSYSKKAIGMAQYVYGDAEWVLPITSNHDTLINSTVALMNRRDHVKYLLTKRNEIFKRDALKAGELLLQLAN